VISSAGVAAWIAHLAFWVLSALGLAFGELGPKQAVTFIFLWFAGLIGLPYLSFGSSLFSSLVAVLDIVLVLIIFKGDVRLT
jgi:hypothetical protein